MFCLFSSDLNFPYVDTDKTLRLPYKRVNNKHIKFLLIFLNPVREIFLCLFCNGLAMLIIRRETRRVENYHIQMYCTLTFYSDHYLFNKQMGGLI